MQGRKRGQTVALIGRLTPKQKEARTGAHTRARTHKHAPARAHAQDLTTIFNNMDKDHSGDITKDELFKVGQSTHAHTHMHPYSLVRSLTQVGQTFHKTFTMDKCTALLSRFDRDGDGRVRPARPPARP